MVVSLCFVPETKGLFTRSESAFLELCPFSFAIVLPGIKGSTGHADVRMFSDKVKFEVNNEL